MRKKIDHGYRPVRVEDGTYCCHPPYHKGGLDMAACCGVHHRKRRAALRHAKSLSTARWVVLELGSAVRHGF